MYPSPPVEEPEYIRLYGRDRWAHRRGEPRLFIVWWTFYLLSASALSFGGMGFIGLVGFEVYRPAAVILLSMVGIGMGLLWPMVRLSQVAPSDTAGSFALDAFVLVMPALVVLAAQAMPWMAGWPASVGLSIGVSFVSWVVLIASLLHVYFATVRTLPRWVWMLVMLGLVLAGPIIAAPAAAAGVSPLVVESLLMMSPITAPFEAARDRLSLGVTAQVETHHFIAAASVLVIPLFAWLSPPSPRGTSHPA
jgi:hypothetical protein